MNICQNPECNKELPERKKYCGEKCLKRHLEIKKGAFKEACPESAKTLQKNKNNLKNEKDIWQGQERRKRAMDTITRLAQECFPMDYDEFACMVSYRTGLSLRKVTDEYLKILLTLGIVERDGNTLRLPK